MNKGIKSLRNPPRLYELVTKSIMRKVATIILSLGSIIGVIQAETLAVLAGGSIQEKIDLAVDGDIVAIFGGTYNQDLTITKRIRLVEVNGQEVILAGNITFSGIADCPPFGGFTVGSNGNKDIEIVEGLIFNNKVFSVVNKTNKVSRI